MKTLIIVVVIIVAAIVLLVGIIAVFGSQLPKSHVATRSILIHKPPPEVYAVIADLKSAPSWRPDVKSVQVEVMPDGRIKFREEGAQGTVNYMVDQNPSTQRMMSTIVDQDLGYSGNWVYLCTPENGGTRVTITESGEVSNVFFRVMSRYVFGHTATIDAYLTALSNHMGESALPQ